MAIFAFLIGYLFRFQHRVQNDGKPAAFMFEHLGIWGDIVLVSPLNAFVYTEFRHLWNSPEIFWSGVASFVLTAGMVNMWRESSRSLNEAFGINGKLTVAGWIHGIYMWQSLVLIFLFYFGTDHQATKSYALVVSVTLAVHVALGTFGPDKVTRGFIQNRSKQVVGVAWLLIAGAFLYVVR